MVLRSLAKYGEIERTLETYEKQVVEEAAELDPVNLVPYLTAENSRANAEVLNHHAYGVVSNCGISCVNVSSSRPETLAV